MRLLVSVYLSIQYLEKFSFISMTFLQRVGYRPRNSRLNFEKNSGIFLIMLSWKNKTMFRLFSHNNTTMSSTLWRHLSTFLRWGVIINIIYPIRTIVFISQCFGCYILWPSSGVFCRSTKIFRQFPTGLFISSIEFDCSSSIVHILEYVVSASVI